MRTVVYFLSRLFGLRLNETKGVRADRAQEICTVGIFCAHSGLRRDGIVHGFLAADERYVPPVRHIVTSSIHVGAHFV